MSQFDFKSTFSSPSQIFHRQIPTRCGVSWFRIGELVFSRVLSGEKK
jgi:hypothetical protein